MKETTQLIGQKRDALFADLAYKLIQKDLASEVSYADLYIRYEYKFLRNMYTKEELETSKELATLESYYKVFDRF